MYGGYHYLCYCFLWYQAHKETKREDEEGNKWCARSALTPLISISSIRKVLNTLVSLSNPNLSEPSVLAKSITISLFFMLQLLDAFSPTDLVKGQLDYDCKSCGWVVDNPSLWHFLLILLVPAILKFLMSNHSESFKLIF